MEIVDIIISAGITIFSLALLVISLLSYWKFRNTKLLFISVIVFIFLIRGILLSISLFNKQLQPFTASTSFWFFDLLILILLYLTSLKR